MSSNIDVIHQIMNDTMQNMIPKELRDKGWVYRDLPKMTTELWEMFIENLGDDNFQLLTYAEYTHKEEISVRGQMLISPEGLENCRKLSEKLKAEKAEVASESRVK